MLVGPGIYPLNFEKPKSDPTAPRMNRRRFLDLQCKWLKVMNETRKRLHFWENLWKPQKEQHPKSNHSKLTHGKQMKTGYTVNMFHAVSICILVNWPTYSHVVIKSSSKKQQHWLYRKLTLDCLSWAIILLLKSLYSKISNSNSNIMKNNLLYICMQEIQI